MIGVPTSAPTSAKPSSIRSRTASSHDGSSAAVACESPRPIVAQRLDGVPEPLTVVMDAAPELDIEVANRILSLGRAH